MTSGLFGVVVARRSRKAKVEGSIPSRALPFLNSKSQSVQARLHFFNNFVFQMLSSPGREGGMAMTLEFCTEGHAQGHGPPPVVEIMKPVFKIGRAAKRVD